MASDSSLTDDQQNDLQGIQHLLAMSNDLLASGEQAGGERAVGFAWEAVQRAQKLEAAQVSGARRLLAGAWLTHANAQRAAGKPEERSAALQGYADAISHFRAVMDKNDPADAHQLAKMWMARGMALLEDRPEAPQEALECFDRALDLREKLPAQKDGRTIWLLSAAWLNRGDLLTRLSSAERAAEAVKSYDEAIALLSDLPEEEQAAARGRLGLAWMNRGLAAAAAGGEEATQEALRCFTKSVEELSADEAPAGEEQSRVLACARLNRGHALLNQQAADAAGAREEALATMALTADFEKTEVMAAQMSLQARHLLCRAVGYKIDEGTVLVDWVTEATDAVDDGLALARHWRQKGTEWLRGMEMELLRFGAMIYRACQPHFLAEFLLDSLDGERVPGAPVAVERAHHIAVETIWSTTTSLREMQRQREAARVGGVSEIMERLEELEQAEQRLQELRAKYLGTATTNGSDEAEANADAESRGAENVV